jgi:hypothetical protein
VVGVRVCVCVCVCVGYFVGAVYVLLSIRTRYEHDMKTGYFVGAVYVLIVITLYRVQTGVRLPPTQPLPPHTHTQPTHV